MIQIHLGERAGHGRDALRQRQLGVDEDQPRSPQRAQASARALHVGEVRIEHLGADRDPGPLGRANELFEQPPELHDRRA